MTTATTLPELVRLLNSDILRVRTGLWLLPATQLSKAKDEASRLGVVDYDLRQPLLEILPEDARWLDLSSATFVQLFDGLMPKAPSPIVLLLNADLILSWFDYSERMALWDTLYRGLPHRSRALLFLMPEEATQLLPSDDARQLWLQECRLAMGLS